MVDMEANMKQAQKELEKLANKCADLSEPFDEFAEYYPGAYVSKAFSSKGMMMGFKWPVYSPKYRKWKQKHGNGPMLILSGRLYSAAARKGKGFFKEIKKDGFTIGVSGIPYSNVHQYGYPKRNIPERPYFKTPDGNMPKRAMNDLIFMIEKFLEKDTTNE